MRLKRKDDGREGEVFATKRTFETDGSQFLEFWVHVDGDWSTREIWRADDCEEQ